MELVHLCQEAMQTAVEAAASRRAGQVALRQVDRALWVLEHTARWAVPPPLEPEDVSAPRLIRPLSWPLFLILLVILRVVRETLSLANLVLGKPPLRSADVVMYIQGKRRYIRALKYHGTRKMRARAENQRPALNMRSLLDYAMCFRRLPANNNNTSDNEQVLIVKNKKNGREPSNETTMERLIEKMMVDLDADSENDSIYTPTIATSDKTESDQESEQDAFQDISAITDQHQANSTPEREIDSLQDNSTDSKDEDKHNININSDGYKNGHDLNNTENNVTAINDKTIVLENSKIANSTMNSTETKNRSNLNKSDLPVKVQSLKEDKTVIEEKIPVIEEKIPVSEEKVTKELKSVKEESHNLIQSEKCVPKSPKKNQKIANGRVLDNSAGKKRGI